MNEQAVRKTFTYKLKPTPEQERAMAFVVRRCRELYNAGLEERQEAWQKSGRSLAEARRERHDGRPERPTPRY